MVRVQVSLGVQSLDKELCGFVDIYLLVLLHPCWWVEGRFGMFLSPTWTLDHWCSIFFFFCDIFSLFDMLTLIPFSLNKERFLQLYKC